MKHDELIEYFDSLQPGEEIEIPVSDRFPISPFSRGDVITVRADNDITAGSAYLVAMRGELAVMRVTVYDKVLYLSDLSGNTATFSEEDAGDVAVLARVLTIALR